MRKHYPFGMMMPGREYQAQPSRFGFNGKENDNDVKGFGNQLDYGMRIYDSRLGKFLSLDPVRKEYESPYMAFANSPLFCIDPSGSDTITVKSRSIDRNGRIAGESGYIGNRQDLSTMLTLFTAYSKDDVKGSMLSSDFLRKYQTISSNYSFSYNGKTLNKAFASILSINNNAAGFDRAVITVTLGQLNNLRNIAIADMQSQPLIPNNILKWRNFSSGEEYDIKAEGNLLGGMVLAHIPNVGIFTNDFLGNIFYGSVWSQLQGIGRTLYDGDYLQDVGGINGTTIPKGIDDPLDGYGLVLGHLLGRNGITPATFNTQLSFTKTSKTSFSHNNNRGLSFFKNINQYRIVHGNNTISAWSKTHFSKVE